MKTHSLLVCTFVLALVATVKPVSAAPGTETIAWHDNYATALAEASARGKMLLVWFASNAPSQSGLEDTLGRCLSSPLGAGFIAARLPTDALLPAVAEKPATRLLDHPAFADLNGQEGLAIIDLRDQASPHYHHVVSVYPGGNGPLGEKELAALLALPPGSLTQRTLIWAIRTHADRPASADGEPSEQLMAEAAAHSRHQAEIDYQGHHQWEERFHAINAKLPPELVAQEVCAESWPGQDLVSAARECVASWRSSSGHWDAVRTAHPQYGFDMRRGARGVWYATGIFGRRR